MVKKLRPVDERSKTGRNRADVLRALGRSGAMHRSALADHVGVSPATITELTRELLELGLIRPAGKRESRGGRPAELLALVPESGVFLGAKVATTRVSGVTVDLAGTVLDSFEAPFDVRTRHPIDDLGAILGPWSRDDRLLGIGLGVPGMVFTGGGGRVTAPALGWSDEPFGGELQAILDIPVLVENDVHTLAVAERLYGRGADVDDFITVTIGHGVGMGVIVGGELHTGARGGAAELGHVAVATDGPVCACGRVGCLEALAAEPAIRRRAVEMGMVGPEATIADVAATPEAEPLFADAGTHLGRAVAVVVTMLAPQMVLISGEGVANWQLFESAFHDAFRANVADYHSEVPVVVDRWDDLDWARGAAALPARTIFAPSASDGAVERLVRSRLTAGAQERASDGG